MNNKPVENIVEQYLKDHGFSGLERKKVFCDQSGSWSRCSCSLSSLFACNCYQEQVQLCNPSNRKKFKHTL